MSKPDRDAQGERREMTVADIHEPAGAGPVEVTFLESARVYRLPREHPRFSVLLGRLREARKDGRVVTIRFASPHADLIGDVQGAPDRRG